MEILTRDGYEALKNHPDKWGRVGLFLFLVVSQHLNMKLAPKANHNIFAGV
jgi:hypothetical protein